MLLFLLRSALRVMSKNKLLSLLKVIALSIGVGVFLLTSIFTLEEKRYDMQHPHHERLYRYVHRVQSPELLESLCVASGPTGPLLKEHFPEVETYARLIFPGLSVSTPGSDNSFNERRFGFTDSTFLTIFNFPINGGSNPGDLLKEPYSVVLTPSAALKYFGTTEDIIGKILLVNGEMQFIVKGVFQEDVSRSHFYFDFLASLSTFEAIKNHPVLSQQIPMSKHLESKGIAGFYNYIRLAPDASAESLISKFPKFIEETRGVGRSERFKPTLQLVSSIHLESDMIYEIQPNGSKRMLFVYFFVGVLILVIGCINYFNISAAEFIKRSRSLGLKKILGVGAASLLFAHLVETFVFALISLTAGLVGSALLLPVFNSSLNRTLTLFTNDTWIILLVVLVFVVIFSDVLPVLKIIIRTKAIDSFKGGSYRKPSMFNGRNILVFFQLACSFCLLCLSFLLYSQIEFLLDKNLGFDSKHVLVLNALSTPKNQRVPFRDQLRTLKNLQSVGMCSSPPGKPFMSYGVVIPQHGDDEEQTLSARQSYVDDEYLRVLGLSLNEGRFFDRQQPSDSTNYVVVNSSAAALIGDQLFDQKLSLPNIFGSERMIKNVVGRIPDFHFASLHHQVEPLLLEYNPERCGYYIIKLDNSNINGSLEEISKLWRSNFPATPFDYYYLEDGFKLLYQDELRQQKSILTIALVSIGLAVLGIFGTTLFVAESKTKEMGIRKSLGAGQFQLLILLIKPVIIVLTIASVVGVPVAHWAGSKWLQQFAFRVNFSPAIFIISFMAILTMVIVAVLYQFAKVTQVNPVDVLKHRD